MKWMLLTTYEKKSEQIEVNNVPAVLARNHAIPEKENQCRGGRLESVLEKGPFICLCSSIKSALRYIVNICTSAVLLDLI